MAVRTLSWVPLDAPPASPTTVAALSGATPPTAIVAAAAPQNTQSGAGTGPAIAGSSALLPPGSQASAAATAPAASAPPRPPDAVPERPVGLPPAPDYMKSAGLEVGPRPIGDIEPEYPESAHLQEGTVTVRVLISEAGHVDNVAIVRSEPKGLFEQAALEAFSKARFEPARYAGLPVKSQLTVEVHFLPINRGARISGRGY